MAPPIKASLKINPDVVPQINVEGSGFSGMVNLLKKPLPLGRLATFRVEGSGEEVADPGMDVLALYRKCPHLGCNVPQLCDRSLWFECLCHGSKYTILGEKRDGPAPRGMDRFAHRLEDAEQGERHPQRQQPIEQQQPLFAFLGGRCLRCRGGLARGG